MRGFFMPGLLERKIVDRFGDLAGGGDAGGRARLRSESFGSAAGVASTATVAAAAQELDALDTEGEAYACGSVVLGIRPYFGRAFCIYLRAFFQIRGHSGAIGPVCTFHPDRLVLLVTLGVTEFLGMRHVEINDILSIHRVGDTVFPQVSDYLKLNHNGKF